MGAFDFLIHGMGMFAESYVLFAIGNLGGKPSMTAPDNEQLKHGVNCVHVCSELLLCTRFPLLCRQHLSQVCSRRHIRRVGALARIAPLRSRSL